MPEAAAITTAPQTQPAAPPPAGHSAFWKDSDGPSFHDILDTINPLQHLPIVATVYRWATGDEPGNIARVAGDGLYGGPIGAAVGLFNAVTRDPEGEDLGERAMNWAFGPGHSKTSGDTAVAAAKPADAAATPAPPAGPATVPATHHSVASVAALYRATKPASPPPQRVANDALPPGVAARPSRAPIPLHPTAASAPAAPQAASAATAPTASKASDPTARAFLAHNAMLQREIATARQPAQSGGHELSSTPVPLQLSGAGLPQARPRLSLMPASAMPGRKVTPAVAAPATTAPTPVAAPPAVAPAAPADFSARMLDALDKYRKLEQQRRPNEPAASL